MWWSCCRLWTAFDTAVGIIRCVPWWVWWSLVIGVYHCLFVSTNGLLVCLSDRFSWALQAVWLIYCQWCGDWVITCLSLFMCRCGVYPYRQKLYIVPEVLFADFRSLVCAEYSICFRLSWRLLYWDGIQRWGLLSRAVLWLVVLLFVWSCLTWVWRLPVQWLVNLLLELFWSTPGHVGPYSGLTLSLTCVVFV